MARLFTINFAYDEAVYNTLVTVRTTPFYIEYVLNNLDANLLLQLPGNKIIAPTPRDFHFPDAAPQHSSRLMNIIIKAVSAHLQTLSY